jgi:aspartate/methionine/tyrosine aminotransferase
MEHALYYTWKLQASIALYGRRRSRRRFIYQLLATKKVALMPSSAFDSNTSTPANLDSAMLS